LPPEGEPPKKSAIRVPIGSVRKPNAFPSVIHQFDVGIAYLLADFLLPESICRSPFGFMHPGKTEVEHLQSTVLSLEL